MLSKLSLKGNVLRRDFHFRREKKGPNKAQQIRIPYYGRLAQMVERSICIREAAGSMPALSKLFFCQLFFQIFFDRML